MSTQLQWGLVGLGRLAEEYLVAAFAAARNGRLVACAGRTAEREFPRAPLYQCEIEAIADELAGIRTAAATGEDGLWLARVTEAVIRSFETGGLVPVDA